MARGDPKTAQRFMSQALRVAEQYHLPLYRADSYANLGYIEMELGQLDSALIKLNEVVRDAELAQRAPKMVGTWVMLGHCLMHKGKFEKALKYFNNSIVKGEEIGFRRATSAAQLGKVESLLELDRIEEAEDELNSIPIKGLEKEMVCDLYLLQSRIYLEKGELAPSKESLRKSLSLAEELNLEIKTGKAMAHKAVILLKDRKRTQALNCLEQAKRILLSKGVLPDIGSILTQFGLALEGGEGESIFLEGLKILLDIGALPKMEYLLRGAQAKGFKEAFRRYRKELHQFKSEKGKLNIYTFGGLSIKRPGELNPIAQKEWQFRKARELLGLILVLSGPEGVTREILASHLWPEMSAQKSRANFRVTLTRLNKTLGYECLRQEGQFLCLDKDRVWVDLWEFENLLEEWFYLKQRGKLHPAEGKARKAAALYRGDFLPGLYNLPIDDKQIELKEKTKGLFYWLARRSKERIEWQEAISFARRLIALDSNDERGCQIIMEGLWSQGDRSGAIRQFERLKSNLRKELGIFPSSETLRLYKKIAEIEA